MLITPSSRQWGLQHATCVDKCSKFVVHNHLLKSSSSLPSWPLSLPTLSLSFHSLPDPKASGLSLLHLCVQLVIQSYIHHSSAPVFLLFFPTESGPFKITNDKLYNFNSSSWWSRFLASLPTHLLLKYSSVDICFTHSYVAKCQFPIKSVLFCVLFWP